MSKSRDPNIPWELSYSRQSFSLLQPNQTKQLSPRLRHVILFNAHQTRDWVWLCNICKHNILRAHISVNLYDASKTLGVVLN